jgi:hypothetical protein
LEWRRFLLSPSSCWPSISHSPQAIYRRRILFVASYLALFVFVVANLRRPGLVILGAGLALNFLAIVTKVA